MNNFYEFLKYASSGLESLEHMDKYFIKSALRAPNLGRWNKRLKHGGVGFVGGAGTGSLATYSSMSSGREDLENRNKAYSEENQRLRTQMENYASQPDMNNMGFMDRLAFLVFGKDYTKYMKNIYKS